jgi:hypothetical protein
MPEHSVAFRDREKIVRTAEPIILLLHRQQNLSEQVEVRLRDLASARASRLRTVVSSALMLSL